VFILYPDKRMPIWEEGDIGLVGLVKGRWSAVGPLDQNKVGRSYAGLVKLNTNDFSNLFKVGRGRGCN